MRASLPILLFAALAGGWLLLVSREPPPSARPPRPAVEAQPERSPKSIRDALLEAAAALQPEVAEQIRKELQAGATDPQRRALLMAWLWHQGGAAAFLQQAEHLLWFIDNDPASEFLDWPPAWFRAGELGPARMEEILSAWRRAVRAHPDDPRVAWRAAKWFERHEERSMVEFLQAAIRAQPDFGPAADALAEWCVRQITLRSPSAPDAKRLLETSLNPEILTRAARRFHQLSESAEHDHLRRDQFRDAARRCFRRARLIVPHLRESDVFTAVLHSPAYGLDNAAYPAPELLALLNAARRQLTRLPVEAFPELPPSVAATLKRLGCSVPQAYESSSRRGPHNVIRGHFYEAERESWAALCSVQDTVRLVVFRDASDTMPETLGGGLESTWMQTTGENSAGFSWAITAAGEAMIRRYHSDYGGPPLPPLDHDGIDSYFVGKASVILYHYKRKWLALQGAD